MSLGTCTALEWAAVLFEETQLSVCGCCILWLYTCPFAKKNITMMSWNIRAFVLFLIIICMQMLWSALDGSKGNDITALETRAISPQAHFWAARDRRENVNPICQSCPVLLKVLKYITIREHFNPMANICSSDSSVLCSCYWVGRKLSSWLVEGLY